MFIIADLALAQVQCHPHSSIYTAALLSCKSLMLTCHPCGILGRAHQYINSLLTRRVYAVAIRPPRSDKTTSYGYVSCYQRTIISACLMLSNVAFIIFLLSTTWPLHFAKTENGDLTTSIWILMIRLPQNASGQILISTIGVLESVLDHSPIEVARRVTCGSLCMP